MILGILALAIVAGATAAGAALLSGYSILAALAIYSLTGVLWVLGFVVLAVARSAVRSARMASALRGAHMETANASY